MKWAISSALLERLILEARAAGGRETCGLLLGSAGRIEEAWPIRNAAADPEYAFLLDPAPQLAAARAARAAGKTILGHYHSHPSGNADPSGADARAAGEEGTLWLIVAGPGAKLWKARAGGEMLGAFEPVEIAVI